VDEERKLSRTTTSLTSAEIVATTFNNNFSGSQLEPITPDLLPVSLAISRYLGVNQSSETLKKAHKAGIVIIVHGPLTALRKPFIQNLVKEYRSTVLSVDQIVLEALATSFSEAANRARQLCMEAGRIHIKTEGMISSGSCETGQKPSDNDDEPVAHSVGKFERPSVHTFKAFNAEFPSICALFGKWDRVTATEQQLTAGDDMCEGPNSLGGRRHRIEGSARGSSVGGPSRTRKSGQKRDSTEVKTVSPLLPVYCDQVDQTKLIAEQAVDSTPIDLVGPKETINVCPTLGVTHLVINAKPELISNILEGKWPTSSYGQIF
ncbi:hypothetical protein CRM22_002862, partial [Opisthorchis felineus]